MSLAAQLNSSTVLTPREREREKTAQQKAEDFMYTVNHALTCLTVTDFVLNPLFSSVFGWDICGHPHDKKSHDHHVHEQKGSWWGRSKNWIKSAYPNFKEWFIGEFIGDVGAVPVTLAVQRFAPGLMTGIQHMLEPVVGGLMHRRSEKAAQRWADANGITHDAKEVVDRAEELYQYEMRHLPQMAMWTLSSVGINYGVMRFRNPELSLGSFAKSKAVGSGMTAALVLGARAFAPDKAHKWDETMGRRVVVPVTKTVGKIFGVEEREVDKSQARRNEDDSTWSARVGQGSSENNTQASRA